MSRKNCEKSDKNFITRLVVAVFFRILCSREYLVNTDRLLPIKYVLL